jgi:ureidoglycolate hydrolase
MNDAGTLPRHMLDIRELTAEAFAPYGQVIAPLLVWATPSGRRG